MDTVIGYIFSFLIDNIKTLYFIFTGIILLEGLVYLLFPDFIRKKIKNLSSFIFRIFGILFLILGTILIFLYKNILSTYF